VYRKDINEKGYQRIIQKDHVEKIRKFLDSQNNVIPNSIVVAFNDKLKINEATSEGASIESLHEYHPRDSSGIEDKQTTIGYGFLKVRVHNYCNQGQDENGTKLNDLDLSDYRSAYVIDGQHRIAGGNASSLNVFFPVTGFLGVTKEDQAFHFIVINRQSKRVSKHDMDAVIPKSIYENLQDRLMSASIYNSDADIVYALDNAADSPFRQSILWGNTKDRDSAKITKGAIDKLIKYTRNLPEDITNLLDEPTLIIAIWSAVKKHLDKSNLWDKDKIVIDGQEYDNQFIVKIAGVIPAIQSVINNAFTSGAIVPDDSKKDISEGIKSAVYNHIQKLPLEIFWCQWLRKSITNDDSIGELSEVFSKSIRIKEVPYREDGKNWFDSPESIEERKEKKKRENAAKKKAKAKPKKPKKPKKLRKA
jgi:DGQHR domain-containing protein